MSRTDKKPEGKEKTPRNRKPLMVMGLLLVMSAMMIMPVSANVTPADNSVDWGGLGTMISGAGDIMPSVSSLIMAVVPIIILLIMVGFITGLFDSIIAAVRSSLSMFK